MKKKNGILIKILALFIAAVLMIPGGIVASAAADAPSSWAQAEVDKARSKGLVLVEADRNYLGNISREMFCMQIVNMVETILGTPVTVTTNNPFDDTDSVYVIKAYQLGIVSGVSATKFGPLSFVTREEIAAMMMRSARVLDQLAGKQYASVAGTESIAFTDQDDISSWALADIRAANALGIMAGIGNNCINPKGNTTVEQSIVMINRLYDGFTASPSGTGIVIAAVVSDPQRTYGEDMDTLKGNNGANIGTEEGAPRQSEEDGVEFYAGEGENPIMPLAKRLDNADGVEPGGNQAVYVSFCPSQKDFGFMLSADTSIGLTIGDSGEPLVFATADNYMTPFDIDFRAEPGNWYNIFLAIDSEGNFQGTLWKDGVPENAAYFSIALGAFENGDIYKNRSWELSIGFKGESTFKISQYSYYTFSGFVKETAIPGTTAIDLNADPMNVVQTVLNDPQVLGGEDVAAITENMGGMFGGIDIKRPSEDGGCFQFITESNAAWMSYNERLLNAGVGEHRGNTQAFLIKFQLEHLENLSFNFIGMGEVVVSFSDGNQPNFVNVQEGYKYPFSDCMPTDLTLESDKWYYGLFAFDTDGNFRSVIWEDGYAEGRAYCEEKLGEQRDDYRDSNWEVVIGFDAGGILDVENYLIMDFDGFSEK